MIKKGDIVNIKGSSMPYWKGIVKEISNGYENFKFPVPVLTIIEIGGGQGHATVNTNKVVFKDNEYWEK